eukprot:GDKJ01020046.1.p1 GENE.GDKJ01020046.1~~GDKJ01020046.1.p1  ORF type:complete len:1145 (+),score=287.29 GDKJ01020046.1:247-3681(+)
MSIPQVIIVGGGLSGLSAAHTALEQGFRVLIVDKSSFMGGNSTKATSGINGSQTKTQREKNIPDSNDIFYADTLKSARDQARPHLIKALTHQSGSAVDWLMEKFNLDLSLLSRLGGHSQPRTHRGKERFPGMTITYALMERFEEIAERNPTYARVVTKAKVTRLLTDKDAQGELYVSGVEFEHNGKKHNETGVVIVATGGYAADFNPDSLLNRVRPDLAHLPTTNGDHCTGDGIKFSEEIGAGVVDLESVQVHPTGLVDPKEPDAKIKFLAAEALRGCGALLLNSEGERFADELGHRDYVTGKMWENKKGPYRLILNGKASKEIEWHCKHYVGRGLMKRFNSGAAVAAEIGIPASKLAATFADYNDIANKKKPCPFNKKFFDNIPVDMNDDTWHVAIVTPVLHYCMGGLAVNELSEVLHKTTQKPIKGLWAVGEVMGGVHGRNRLGGNSLLDCVVFGRIAGVSAAKFLNLNPQIASKVIGSVSSSSGFGADGAVATNLREISVEEVAKHNTEKDCWVIVNGQVLNVTDFMNDHPGGKKAILLFAGRDATEEFNMIHKAEVVAKYAPQSIIGVLKGYKGLPGKAPLAPSSTSSTTVNSNSDDLLSAAEVAKHNSEQDCWVIIHNQVYDVSKFLNDHPGGKKVLLRVAGQDATSQFDKFHNAQQVLAKYGPELLVGPLNGKRSASQSSVVKSASVVARSDSFVNNEEMNLYGELNPYGDPCWYQGWRNPGYYNESHKKFRDAVRKFCEVEIMPNCHKWDEAKCIPREAFVKAGDAGILQACVYMKWLDINYAGSNLPGGIKPEEFDAFHFLILLDEMSRCGSGGIMWGLFGGLSIGLPPVYHYGSKYLKDRVLKDCLTGRKNICLCITEPSAGSDVANLMTEAKKSDCGKYYIVNGEKKWITNGVYSDYFTVAVRTGGKGMGGVSLLLIERSFGGVSTKQMNCMGVWASGTTYVTFEDVKVPVENLIGKENEGFRYIMSNFNYERMGFLGQGNRFARVCYEDAFKYAQKRITFGKPLMEHQVIRFKLAEMARQIEANWAQIEQICYQLTKMSKEEATLKLAGPIALAKVQTTKVLEYCAREAAQVFGGLSYSRGGQGERVERLYREVRAYAIPGGSEEIMLDLGLKQQEKFVQNIRQKIENKAGKM